MSNVVNVRRDGSELVEHEMQQAPAEQLTGALSELVAIAKEMQPDDLAIEIDAASGAASANMAFRCITGGFADRSSEFYSHTREWIALPQVSRKLVIRCVSCSSTTNFAPVIGSMSDS